ncbi:MAG: hypothetical protein ACRDWH_01205 [Acidimicrobiia bacterium]
MTSAAAHLTLQSLIGSALGTGEWTTLNADHIQGFERAVGHTTQEVPLLLILSLIPSLASSIDLPIPKPRMSMNYGLDTSRLLTGTKIGERVRARVSLLDVHQVGAGLQVKRQVLVENEAGDPVLEAETLTRLVW